MCCRFFLVVGEDVASAVVDAAAVESWFFVVVMMGAGEIRRSNAFRNIYFEKYRFTLPRLSTQPLKTNQEGLLNGPLQLR